MQSNFDSSDHRQAEAMKFTAGLDRTPRWADTTTYPHFIVYAHSQRCTIIHSPSLFFPPPPSRPPHRACATDPSFAFHFLRFSTLRLHLYPVSITFGHSSNSESTLQNSYRPAYPVSAPRGNTASICERYWVTLVLSVGLMPYESFFCCLFSGDSGFFARVPS